MTTHFMHGERKVPISINYYDATFTYDAMGLDILGIVTDQTPIIQIIADDKIMLKLWYHFVQDLEPEGFEVALRSLTTKEMQEFKEAFWDEVVNFSAPPIRETLRTAYQKVKDHLKRPENLLKNLSADSSEESE